MQEPVRGGFRALPGPRRRRGAVRQAVDVVRLHDPVHRRGRQSAPLLPGFRGGGCRRRALPGRDEGARGHGRTEERRRCDAVGRQCDNAHRAAVALCEGDAARFRAVAAGPIRRVRVCGDNVDEA